MKGARYTLNKEEGYKEEERYKVNKDKRQEISRDLFQILTNCFLCIV